MTVAPVSAVHPRRVSLRARIEAWADRVHAPGDAELEAAGFVFTCHRGWFGLITHRQISHPAIRNHVTGSKPRSGAVAIAPTPDHGDRPGDRHGRKEAR